MRMILLPLGLASSIAFAGMTATDAFNDGAAFGKTEIGIAKAKISTTEASSTTKGVPNYTATDPASGYYMGGTGSLTAPATSDVTGCTSTTGTTDPDAHTHGKCEGVRMLMKDPGKKDLMFPLSKTTDPLVVKRNTVAGDAETYLGSLIVSGAYSGCATKTVKDPDTYQTETCNQFLTAGEESCNEILTVTLTISESCVPGTWYGGQTFGFAGGGWLMQVDAFCDINRADGLLALRFTPVGLHGVCTLGYLDAPKAPFTVSDTVGYSGKKGYVNYELTNAFHWKGACTVTNYIGYEPGYTQGCASGTCSYTFRMTENRWGNIAVGGSGELPEPRLVITETDTWDNQCGPLEARLP